MSHGVTVDLVKTLGPSAGAIIVIVILVVPIVQDMVTLQTDTVRELSEMNTHIEHLPAEMGQAVAEELRAHDVYNGGVDDEPYCSAEDPDRNL